MLNLNEKDNEEIKILPTEDISEDKDLDDLVKIITDAIKEKKEEDKKNIH